MSKQQGRMPVINQEIIALYDEYTHAPLPRRVFMKRLTAITGSTVAASALLPVLENNYAQAAMLAADDARISAQSLSFPSEGGDIKGYLATPKGATGKLPAVIVIHENRGLNPHIEDITRRLALAGFLALGVDYLSLLGGTPADEDKARDMFAKLDAKSIGAISLAALRYLKNHPQSTGRVGVVGFCWGGAAVNQLATLAPDLNAGVAFYGMQANAVDAAKIKAPLQLHYASLDERINAGIPAYEAALKAAGAPYELFIYADVNHAFNNDTNAARYNETAAKLAWQRTLDFLKKNLG
ncbi:dienelactone hydrolase family protein [Uliginosibacterium sp. 31-16]|uniref:dienelactone hydrolase family protein n=1 Tax=Uliginosibacterium sp. 31-16 TaxID=3068315 RepID=UPI00273FC400|nr:dienelactone hydrolase family protein [Uliginosibacterium sp. 31-16]MDP5239443.1 dienelactone hydrolase family protein [Uliginosibacterium sp. 31-16]